MFLPPALRKAKNLPQAGAVDAEVHAQARARLLSAIPEAVFESAPSSTAYTVGFLQSLIYKPVAVTAASLVFVAGGWVTTSAAQYSLPGDTLYNVKIIAERAQIRMASLDRRAVLHTEFAGRRLEEVAALQRAVQEEPNRAQYIPETVTAYQREIASATTDLQTLQEQDQTQALSTAASVLDQVALLTRNAEEITTASSGQEGVSEDQHTEEAGVNTRQVAEQVTQTTQSIADVATDVTIIAHETAPSDRSTVEVGKVFRNLFGEIETRRALVLHRITTIEGIAVEQKEILAQAGVTLPEKSTFANMKKAMEEMDAKLPSIMDGFAAGGVRSALDTLKEMDAALAGMEKELTLIEESITQAFMENEAKEKTDDDTQETGEETP